MGEKLFTNHSILQTKYFEAHQDWEVPIPGFFILAPHRKIKSVEEFSPEEALDYIQAKQKIRKAMREVLNIQAVYFFQNEDTDHNFHLWIFPRLPWMETFGRKIQSVRPIMEHAKRNLNNQETKDKVNDYVQKMQLALQSGLSI